MVHATSRYQTRSKSRANKLQFFNLPYEIRHQIYDEAFDAARIVYSIHTRTPQVRHCRRPWDRTRDLPVSDKDFEAPLLVSKRFHREVKPVLFSKSQVVLVADVDHQEISPDCDLTALAPYVRYLEMSSHIVKQKESWSLFPNLGQITITHDAVFDITMNLWESWEGQPEQKIRAAVVGSLKRIVLNTAFMSRLPDLPRTTTGDADIVLKGHYTANRSTHDPRDSITFLSVYENDYTYDTHRKSLKMLPPTCTSERMV